MDDLNDLIMLRDSFREVLRDECPLDQVIAHIDGEDFGDKLWRTILGLGWPALTIPESFGGSELGMRALSVLHRELGRALAPVALTPTLIVADIIALFGSEDQKSAWLPLIAEGARATCSLPAAPPIRMEMVGPEAKLFGDAAQLFHADGARLALILAETDAGDLVRVLIDLEQDGVRLEAVVAIDGTRPIGRIALNGVVVPAARILSAPGLEERLAQHGALAVAADSAGGSEAILELTLDYLKTRQQFDRPIGSFQALKHRCADHKMALVAADAVLEQAVASFAANTSAAIEISAAKQASCDAYADLAQDAIQLHGGIGFTWEHPCHLFLKRAKLNQAVFGSSAWHLDRIAAQLTLQD